MGQETVKTKEMKNYLLPEDGRFRAETVYLSILPKLYPDTRHHLSDVEKAADYKMNYSLPHGVQVFYRLIHLSLSIHSVTVLVPLSSLSPP